MPFQSFRMRVIIFIFRKINLHPIHIQYWEFIHTCLFCFGVHNNLKLIRYGKHSHIKSPMSSSRKRYSVSWVIRAFGTAPVRFAEPTPLVKYAALSFGIERGTAWQADERKWTPVKSSEGGLPKLAFNRAGKNFIHRPLPGSLEAPRWNLLRACEICFAPMKLNSRFHWASI